MPMVEIEAGLARVLGAGRVQVGTETRVLVAFGDDPENSEGFLVSESDALRLWVQRREALCGPQTGFGTKLGPKR